MLPDVRDSAADFGQADNEIFGSQIPITSLIGDQQSALVGQACFEPGMVKSTYGTGCFVLLNTGDRAVASKNRLLTTIALQLNNKPTYALEGSIFIAGAAVQWLEAKQQTDSVGLIHGTRNLPAFLTRLRGQDLIRRPRHRERRGPRSNTAEKRKDDAARNNTRMTCPRTNDATTQLFSRWRNEH